MVESVFILPVLEGQRIGLRINNSNIICAVHPGTTAANVGLKVDDLVVAVDDVECAGGAAPQSLCAASAR